MLKDFILKLMIGFGIGIAISNLGIAAPSESPISIKAAEILSKQYPGTKVVILPGSELPALKANEALTDLQLGRSLPTGQAEIFMNTNQGRMLSGLIKYEARQPSLVALRRIRPGEHLSRDDFQIQDVNVAQGMNYEFRGQFVDLKTPIEQYEARQTILEGQYPLRSGIQRVPDVKRGDMVQVRLIAGGIQLSTAAQAQEPGYRNASIRVLTTKSKKELQGTVKENGVVEVLL